MRCLNEDDKEQYTRNKNIITAVLVSDTVPEEFPHNGKYISNLTEDDILAPGSRMMILDGSDDIYVMKESNFNPDNVIGKYEITVYMDSLSTPGGMIAVRVYLKDEKGNLIDSTGIAYRAEGGYEHACPYTFHDLAFSFSGSDMVITNGGNNTVYIDGIAKNNGETVLTLTYNTVNAWRNAGLLPKKLENDITSKTGVASTDWLKIGG